MGAISLIALLVAAIAFSAGGILIGKILVKGSTNPQKGEPYECGIETIGGSWLQYTVGYYLFAIIFLIFDVETVFVFPWAVVMKNGGITAYVEILIFFFILGLGLLYGWKKHALKWE